MHWIVQQRHGPGRVEGEDIFLEVHCATAVVVEYSEDGLSQEDSLISQRSLTVYHPDHVAARQDYNLGHLHKLLLRHAPIGTFSLEGLVEVDDGAPLKTRLLHQDWNLRTSENRGD